VNTSVSCIYSKVIDSDYVIISLEITDTGDVDVMLGIKIIKTNNGFSLC